MHLFFHNHSNAFVFIIYRRVFSNRRRAQDMCSNQAPRSIATTRDTTAERLRHGSGPFVTTYRSINFSYFLRIFVFITVFYLKASFQGGQEPAQNDWLPFAVIYSDDAEVRVLDFGSKSMLIKSVILLIL